MVTFTKKYRIISAAGILIITLIYFTGIWKSDENIDAAAFTKLRKARVERKENIIRYFNGIQQLAEGIKDDKTMLDFFMLLKSNSQVITNDMEFEIDKYFVNKYGNFYDILFIDNTGYVMHSILKESDYHKNLFEGNLAGTKLARNIRNKSGSYFVDYEYYSPSDEPAAFFAVSVDYGGELHGWFVLQCSINNLNTILSNREGLGRTGEVYLVNKDKLMLSESRFIEDDTILKLKVDTHAVKEALANNEGERIIEDYRGIKVFSSFEKFDYFGNTWIVIAEIDEDEVVTDFYRKNEDYLLDKVFEYVEKNPGVSYPPRNISTEKKRVDMNEFAEIPPGDILYTKGVSTCTGVAIMYPERFAYLTHISPTDEIYSSDLFSRLFRNSGKTDFLGEIVRRIKYYHLFPYELRNLQFVVAAPHKDSFKAVVNKLLDNGLDLSNIKLMYKPGMRGVNMQVNLGNNSVEVEWYTGSSVFLTHAADMESLGRIVMNIARGNFE